MRRSICAGKFWGTNMLKPTTLDGYDKDITDNCERVLVTLLAGLGPWRDSVYLVGGLTPRYLIDRRPPDVPAHAGTGDVDIVIELHMLTQTEAYHSLEDNFKKLGFERAVNNDGKPVSWRWLTRVGKTTMILELLADDPERSGGKVVELPTEGRVSAMNIPQSSIVFVHHKVRRIKAELLGDNGIASADLRHADLVAFTCLKALAFDHRTERKDAHDLVYCLQHYEAGFDAIVGEFSKGLKGQYGDTIRQTLDLLGRHFVDDEETEGYRKLGPVAVAKFELGDHEANREDRALRQRDIAEMVGRLVAALPR